MGAIKTLGSQGGRLKCGKRPELVVDVEIRLDKAYKLLKIDRPTKTEIKVVFENRRKQGFLFGRVDVNQRGVLVVFDGRCRTIKGEDRAMAELKDAGSDYPGVSEALAHEVSHVEMWGLTGLDRQPATKLIDEGWARLVEKASEKKSTTIKDLVTLVKKDILQGLVIHSTEYRRCLTIGRPINQKESSGLNGAESTVGMGLLLWVKTTFGNEAMIGLLRDSPWVGKRNDEEFEPVELKPEWENNEQYSSLMMKMKKGEITTEEFPELAYGWESKQSKWALLKATGMKKIKEVKDSFERWIDQ
ncbi:MAG: hypothetical protein WC686_01330 [Candidatus Shapirobacteria bacterium]